MSHAALVSLSRHLDNLTEQNVVFVLFDQQLPIEEREAMALQLEQTPRPVQFATGKPLPPPQLGNNQSLEFIGPNSWLLFHILGVGAEWLTAPVAQWDQFESFKGIQRYLRDLNCVNDAAERCFEDVTDYRHTVQDSVHRDEVILVVQSYREVFHDLRKGALDAWARAANI